MQLHRPMQGKRRSLEFTMSRLDDICHVLRRTAWLSPLILGKINIVTVAPVGDGRCWTSIKCYFVYSGSFLCDRNRRTCWPTNALHKI